MEKKEGDNITGMMQTLVWIPFTLSLTWFGILILRGMLNYRIFYCIHEYDDSFKLQAFELFFRSLIFKTNF
jgi:hypothetical protein